MSEPRIPLLPFDAAHEAGTGCGVPKQMADLSVFRVLLHQPRVAKAINDLLFSLLVGSDLDARLRELIIMRIGWTTGSVYEWTQHWRVALQIGVDEEELLAVRDWRAHDRWSTTDRAILTATDETLATGCISPGTWAECAKHLGSETERLELVAAIGCWSMISGLLRSLEVPLEEGVLPWPPDGATPAEVRG